MKSERKEAKAKSTKNLKCDKEMWKRQKLFDIWVPGMEDEQRNSKVKSAKSQNKVRNKLKVKSGLEKKKNV